MLETLKQKNNKILFNILNYIQYILTNVRQWDPKIKTIYRHIYTYTHIYLSHMQSLAKKTIIKNSNSK